LTIHESGGRIADRSKRDAGRAYVAWSEPAATGRVVKLARARKSADGS
jgi:hypothetical protein